MDRRKFIGTGIALGSVALAGCTGAEEESEESISPPSFNGRASTYDPMVQFMIRSSEYQNHVLTEENTEGVTRPSVNFDLEEYQDGVQFIVQSEDYQNELLEREFGE
jgi:hypothetical protein